VSERTNRFLFWFRVALAIGGAVALVFIVRGVGARAILATLKPALAWLPLICLLELARMVCDTVSSALAFGPLASRIPKLTLLRAHVIGQSLSALAPAPRVVNESIKIGLVAPYTGAPAATSVGFVNQAATLIAGGLFSIPCGVAMYALGGQSFWLWASAGHCVVLVVSGVVVRAITRADALGRFIERKLPRFASRFAAFREHNVQVGFFAAGPSSALFVGRVFQTVQYGIAAHAVGIEVGVLGSLATEGVSLIATAVGVLVPGGLGANEGAFTLAAGLLATTVARAASLALLMRCMQLAWVPIGAALALVRGPRAPGS
jgi:hypothetical protein